MKKMNRTQRIFFKSLSVLLCAALAFSSAALVSGNTDSVFAQPDTAQAAAETALETAEMAKEQTLDSSAPEQADTAEVLEGLNVEKFTAALNKETDKYKGTANSNRHPLEPVYVELDGKSYNLLNPVQAIAALTKAKTDAQLKYVLFTYLELGFTDILNMLFIAVPDATRILKESEYVSENFLPGDKKFLTSSADGACWSLGYSQKSLVPDDILSGKKKYYLAGYLLQNLPSNTVETVLDDMKVRTIVLDDGSGRGLVSFSTIDCIGIANADIRDIRALLKDTIEEYGIKSVNVFSTHCHSEIDTLGLWNPFFLKAGNNILASLTKDKLLKSKAGPDEEFMALLKKRTADSVKEACAGMKRGEMYLATKDGAKYMFDKRDPSVYETDITTLRFVPYDASVTPTLILNMAGHPYITGLKTDESSGKELSADYVYYAEEVVNRGGYNFMFFNGAILGVYTDRGQTNDGVDMTRRSQQAERFGREIGYFAMSMTKTYEQILEADYVDWETINAEKNVEGYTLWCEDWEPVNEKRVDPILNIILSEVTLTVENPIIEGAGKLGLVNHTVFKGADGYYKTVSEIGYLEIGKDLKVAMMPGEYTQELISGGGVMDAESAFSCKDFGYPSLNEIVGAKLICFGLANDELGYIVPDNDYCMIFFDDVQPFGDHYQESIAFGRCVASDTTRAFEIMYNSIEK